MIITLFLIFYGKDPQACENFRNKYIVIKSNILDSSGDNGTKNLSLLESEEMR